MSAFDRTCRSAPTGRRGVFKYVAVVDHFSRFMPHLPGVPGCNCSEFQCLPRQGCRGRQVIDPCGCCTHCAKTKGQVCGGPSWRYGNCDPDLVCALVVGLDSARPPQTGVCKGTTAATYTAYNSLYLRYKEKIKRHEQIHASL